MLGGAGRSKRRRADERQRLSGEGQPRVKTDRVPDETPPDDRALRESQKRRSRYLRALQRGVLSASLYYTWVGLCTIGARWLGVAGIRPLHAALLIGGALLWTGGFFVVSKRALFRGSYNPRLGVALATSVGSVILLAFNVLDGFSILGAVALVAGCVLNLSIFAEAHGFAPTFARSVLLVAIYGVAYVLVPHKPETLSTGQFPMMLLVVLAIGIALGVVAAGNQSKARRIVDLLKARERQAEELAAANAKLQQLSTLDGLTGLANRRHFDQALARELGRIHRHREAQSDARAAQPARGKLSLVLVDVDHFKAYNDHCGHLAGDECLRQVADAMRRALKRPGDYIARYGGEEFAVLLSDTTLEGGLVVARRILSQVEELRIPHPASPVSPHVSVSAGVADSNCDPAREAEDLVARADEALYHAKEGGRARVEAAPARSRAEGSR